MGVFMPRHDHIGKNQIKRLAAKSFHCARSVVANRYLVARHAKSARKRSQGVGVVIYKKQVGLAWQAGSLKS
jgi:hypothetical protein